MKSYTIAVPMSCLCEYMSHSLSRTSLLGIMGRGPCDWRLRGLVAPRRPPRQRRFHTSKERGFDLSLFHLYFTQKTHLHSCSNWLLRDRLRLLPLCYSSSCLGVRFDDHSNVCYIAYVEILALIEGYLTVIR